MSLDAQALFTKALKEGNVYDVFDNVLGLINKKNSEELGIPVGSTDSGEEYGNTFKNAFSWAKSYGRNNEQQLLIDAQNVKVLPGEDREFKVAQKLLNTYKNYTDQAPGLVAALDLLTGKLTPEETRKAASYANTAAFVTDAERGVQNAQAQISTLQRQLQQLRDPNQRAGIEYEIAKNENILNERRSNLARLVNKAKEQYDPELNISSSYEQKDFSNLIDRYGLQDAEEYNPIESARSKITSGEQISNKDLIAIATQRGQNKTARQLEQELGLSEGTFRSALIDDLGRQYTSYGQFFSDDPVIQEKVNQSRQAYDLARAATGNVDVAQADVDRAVQAMPEMSTDALTQASATAQELVNAQQAQPVQQIGQIQNMQPQGLMNQIVADTPFQTYGTTQQYLGQDLENIKLSNVKDYLSSLDGGSYLSLLSRMFGR